MLKYTKILFALFFFGAFSINAEVILKNSLDKDIKATVKDSYNNDFKFEISSKATQRIADASVIEAISIKKTGLFHRTYTVSKEMLDQLKAAEQKSGTVTLTALYKNNEVDFYIEPNN